MFLQELAGNSQLFLLIFVRITAIVFIAPLLSSSGIPAIAKIGLAFFASYAIFPWVIEAGYPIPENGLAYAALIIGELGIGIIIGFFLVIIYAAFLVAGQFFSLQMGFGASQVFDPLAQIQIPLMGQFMNIMAMFVFVTIGGFQKIFLFGIYQSFKALRAWDFVLQKNHFLTTILKGAGYLFEQALIISFPVLGTLLLVSITMGLLAKAAPQMNLLMLGFPIKIGVAFIVLFMVLPFALATFAQIIDTSFTKLLDFIQAGAA